MKIIIGNDHASPDMKKELVKYLEELGHEVVNFGVDTSESCNYPDIGEKVGRAIAAGEADCGILICGTGVGISLAANKVKGCYAALVTDIYQAQRAALSNNANVITMGAQVIGSELAKCLVKEYLSLTFDPVSRSRVKIERIMEYESA